MPSSFRLFQAVKYGLIALWTVVVVGIVAGVFIALGHPDDGGDGGGGSGGNGASSAAQSVSMSLNVRHHPADLAAFKANMTSHLAEFLGIHPSDIVIGNVQADNVWGGHKVELTVPRGSVNTLVHGADYGDKVMFFLIFFQRKRKEGNKNSQTKEGFFLFAPVLDQGTQFQKKRNKETKEIKETRKK